MKTEKEIRSKITACLEWPLSKNPIARLQERAMRDQTVRTLRWVLE